MVVAREALKPMDRITESLLEEFSKEHEITSLPEETRFEHFACYVTVRRQYGETFDTEDIITGAGQDTGIDGVATIINGALVTEVDDFEEIHSKTTSLDVVFMFVQATRSGSFDTSKIGSFAFGVSDFFDTAPKLPRNDMLKEASALMAAIYKHSSKFKRGNPACRMYYVTTGKLHPEDPNLEARRTTAISDLEGKGLFGNIEFTLIGAEGLQKLYRQTKNAISREFTFSNRTVVPEIDGVTDAYLGLISAPEFLSILRDESGDMIKSIFYDNVRDWQGDNTVNSEIRSTLESDMKARFALMNNGITIIARNLQPTGNRFHIEDFQIVNGCQTSHVLFNQRDHLDETVMIPLRLIATQNEEVINSIIKATNRQTQVKEEQFFALTEFPKTLEAYFQTFPNGRKLYYERRSRQYDSLPIEKTRIVTQDNMVRAFAATFLQVPHRTIRGYKALKARVGKDLFVDGHRPEPYYVAAFAWYKLEYYFRSQKIETKYKPARYHLLLAARLLANPGPLPRMQANEMEGYCGTINAMLWDTAKADNLFIRAKEAVDEVAEGVLERDTIHSQPFTESLMAVCGAPRRSK
jgi:hypothetical protein